MGNSHQEKFKWIFSPNFGGLIEGLSGKENYFTKSDNLGRESSQNSINAVSSEDEKVVVKYQLKNLDSSYFPGREDYINRIKSAKKLYEDRYDKLTGDEPKRLSAAIKTLEQDTIKTLVISDFHTKGLWGKEKDFNSPYCRFMRSDGISSEQGSNAGSYGLGKNALLRYSQVKAITLFSQHFNDDGVEGINTLFTGRSNLGVHIDENNDETRSTGFMAKKITENYEWEAFRNENTKQFTYPIKREKFGTDIYIWGFQDTSESWEVSLAMGLIQGFFQAIIENKIEFEIYDEDKLYLKINSENITECFEFIKEESSNKNFNKESQNTFQRIGGYIKCSDLKNEFLKEYTEYIEGLGRINIRIYADDNDESLQNHYCIMRKPLMTIQEKPFRKMGSPYQAICKLLDPQGNHVFMHLEDPTHKELDEAHVRKKGFEKKYGNLLKVVEKKIRDKIKMIDGKSSKNKGISGLNKYFNGKPINSPSPSAAGNTEKDKDIHEPILNFRSRLKKRQEALDISKSKERKKSVTLSRRPSSKGKKGGKKGTHNFDKKTLIKNGEFRHGAGEGSGNAKLDDHGKKETIIDAENLYIMRTRKEDNDKIYKFKVIALRKAEGTLRFGYTNREDGQTFLPINGAKLLNCSLEKYDANKTDFKDLNLSEGQSFEFELELPTSSNIVIGTY